MKKNFNEQKGKNGKSRKKQKSETGQKDQILPSNIDTKKSIPPSGKGNPLDNVRGNTARKSDPDIVLENDPWMEVPKDDLEDNAEKDKEENTDKTSIDGNIFNDDPASKIPPEKSSVTDPTTDDKTIKDSLF